MEDTEDVVEEVEEENMVVEADKEEKVQRIVTARIAEWTITPPKTTGSVRNIQINNCNLSLGRILDT